MSHQRNSQSYIGTDNPSYREFGRGYSQRRWQKSCGRVGLFLVALTAFATLTLLACLDDGDSLSSIADQLKKNAEAFEYTIGKTGGVLTIATISKPLTLNLALADDSGSAGVLGYLFDGLTEISWLTDEVEPSLAES